MPDIDHVATDRLILRRPNLADEAAFVTIHADPETHRFNPAGAMAPDRARAAFASDLAHWDRHGHGMWAAALRDAPAVAIGFGGIALRQFGDQERANLGFRFATSAWGRGYATELARAALGAAGSLLGLDEVWASVRENNLASIQVLEKIGMARVERVSDPREGVASSFWYVARSSAR